MTLNFDNTVKRYIDLWEVKNPQSNSESKGVDTVTVSIRLNNIAKLSFNFNFNLNLVES